MNEFLNQDEIDTLKTTKVSLKVLLIVTGSISAYKAVSLANLIRQNGHQVKVILTESALNFIPKITFSAQGIETYVDKDEWGNVNKDLHNECYNVNKVLHIELSQWCDICLIAPLTANTLGKISNGIADNLATCAFIALNNKKIIIAPAMNTYMYENVIVKDNFRKLIKYYKKNITIVEPTSKMLACGVEGKGALANIKDIVSKIKI